MFRILNFRQNKILILVTIIFVLALLFIVRGRTRSVSEIQQLKSIILNSLNSSESVASEPPPVSPPVEVVTEPEPELWLTNSTPVTIWMDLPNAFPWRNCLQEYNGVIVPTDCRQQSKSFVIDPVRSSEEERRFVWRTSSGKCVSPNNKKVSVTKCGGEGSWVWTVSGQFQWRESAGDCVQCRKCVTSLKAGAALQLNFCQDLAEDQNLELGTWQGDTLAPLDEQEWRRRQEKMRDTILAKEKKVVSKALEDVDVDNSLHEFDKTEARERRRAAVFYLDKGAGGVTMAKWWIFTWRFIGLDTAQEGFDLVFMTHPANVDNLPEDCHLVTDGYKINFTSPGQCLFRPYLGIAYRDKSYDPYLNSQECLFGPGSEFLSQYSTLLRADLDTFPTPHMLGYWPKGVVVDIQYSTNHGLDNIKQALRDLACSVGIEHREWFNMGSTWYGDGRRVRNLARLTVALNKYGRAEMFGPGTACRCATCHQLPKTCQWGGGPYAGTLLLYLQEIAMNK